jgi:16S rRNA U516 pseudouridylate synthase RsuA-like enzyme
MRLQKYLALAGVASRRRAEELIAQGRVSVNGTVVRQMGQQVDSGTRYVLMENLWRCRCANAISCSTSRLAL